MVESATTEPQDKTIVTAQYTWDCVFALQKANIPLGDMPTSMGLVFQPQRYYGDVESDSLLPPTDPNLGLVLWERALDRTQYDLYKQLQLKCEAWLAIHGSEGLSIEDYTYLVESYGARVLRSIGTNLFASRSFIEEKGDMTAFHRSFDEADKHMRAAESLGSYYSELCAMAKAMTDEQYLARHNVGVINREIVEDDLQFLQAIGGRVSSGGIDSTPSDYDRYIQLYQGMKPQIEQVLSHLQMRRARKTIIERLESKRVDLYIDSNLPRRERGADGKAEISMASAAYNYAIHGADPKSPHFKYSSDFSVSDFWRDYTVNKAIPCTAQTDREAIRAFRPVRRRYERRKRQKNIELITQARKNDEEFEESQRRLEADGLRDVYNLRYGHSLHLVSHRPDQMEDSDYRKYVRYLQSVSENLSRDALPSNTLEWLLSKKKLPNLPLLTRAIVHIYAQSDEKIKVELIRLLKDNGLYMEAEPDGPGDFYYEEPIPSQDVRE